MNGGPATEGARAGPGGAAAADGPDVATVARTPRGWIDRLPRGRPRRDRLALALVLACQLALATVYARATPPWETPDEQWHMGYVTWLRETHRLPPLTAEMLDTPLRQEASQAPLYYVLAAAATLPWPFGPDDLARAFVENPTRFKGVGLAPRQHNYALHGPWDDPAVPIIRALRAARAVAALFGLLAAWAAWRLARQLRPGQPWFAVAAAAWVAFTPQVLFLSGAASNDSAVAALATLALTAAVAFPDRPGDGAAARLGAWYGLAALAKSSALALGPIVAVSVVFGAWRSRSSRGVMVSVVRWGAISLVAAIATGGWWYIRNVVQYGTLFGRALHLAMPWAHRVPHSLARLARDDAFDLLFMSYWGVFGWGTVRYPRWVYDVAQWVVAAAVLGGVLTGATWWRTRRVGGGGAGVGVGGGTGGAMAGALLGATNGGERTVGGSRWWGFGLCAAWSAITIVTLVVWMRQVEANWGRLLFPALGAITVLIVAGLGRLKPRGAWVAVALAGLVVWSVTGPVIALRSAYGPPRFLSESEVLALDDRVDWRMGDAVTLLSFTPLEPTAANPGFWPVRLCWQAIRRPDFEPSAFVHLVGAADAIMASYDGTPGGGTWPGGAWRPGEAVCERIEVAIGQPEQPVPAPAVYRVAVGMFDRDSQERMVTVDRNGQPVVGNFVGQVKVHGTRPDRTPRDAGANIRFGDGDVDIRLVDRSVPASVCAGSPLTLTLTLDVEAPPTEDLQLMVHLRQPGSTTAAAQADGAIAQRGLPYPSSAWSAGERLEDVRAIDLPEDLTPGPYAIAVGFYRLSDGTRLNVLVAGTEVADRAYVLDDLVEVRACP